jgi:hypothetical protein
MGFSDEYELGKKLAPIIQGAMRGR